MRANELGEPRGETSPWFNIDPDLLVEVFSEGPFSAVKVTDLKTGKSVISNEFRSRMANKNEAIRLLDLILND